MLGPFPIPAKLAAHSTGRAGWIAALPDTVAALAARWSLTLGPPFEPGGECSWVAPTDDGRVLKVGWTHDEARDEAAGLRAWDGCGAVQVLAEHRDGETTALLLERAVSGTPLSALPGPEQDLVLGDLLRRLRIEPPVGFRPLHEMCDAWADAACPPPTLDPGLARAALALFRALPRDDVPPALLATDLHAGNVLAARREPWLLIDPKPYAGDPAYDVTQHLLNDPARLTTDPRRFVRRIAHLAALDADRVTAWLFARCVVEAGDWPYDVTAIAAVLRP
jgi:streptomycin 6-kinase